MKSQTTDTSEKIKESLSDSSLSNLHIKENQHHWHHIELTFAGVYVMSRATNTYPAITVKARIAITGIKCLTE